VLMHVGGPGLWTGEYPLLSRARSIGSVIADAPTHTLYLSPKDWQRIVVDARAHLPSIFNVALMISSISCPDLLTTSPAWPPIIPPIAAEFIREITTLPALV